MNISAKALAVCLLLYSCAADEASKYWTEEECPTGDEGWKTCFAGCASPKMTSLATNDPDDYVYACSAACEKACAKMSFRVRSGENPLGVPCSGSKGKALTVCKKAGWKP